MYNRDLTLSFMFYLVLFSWWFVEFTFSNVFVLNFSVCTSLGFLGLGCSSVVLLPSLLSITVLTADFGLYFNELNFLNLRCCKSFLVAISLDVLLKCSLFLRNPLLSAAVLFRFPSCFFMFSVLFCHNIPLSVSLRQ